MGSGGVAIAALPTVICLKVPFSDGLGGGVNTFGCSIYQTNSQVRRKYRNKKNNQFLISDLPNNFQVSDIVKELIKEVKLGNIVD